MNLKKSVFLLGVIAAFLAVMLTAGCSTASPSPQSVSGGFVWIEGGTFIMGSPADEPGRMNWEGLQRQETVSGFYMGKYEVTQKEWFEVMGTTVRQQRDVTEREMNEMMAATIAQMSQQQLQEFQQRMGNFPPMQILVHGEGDDYPMYYVSWLEVIQYCNARSRRERLTPAYTITDTDVTWNRNANGYRLPTEAEWEYACRAGTITAYNTGAAISDTTGWYRANSSGGAQPVGQNPANAWGLYDMHGNVMEWCWDWFEDYSGGTQTVPPGAPVPEPGRVTRSGSWMDTEASIRSASRARHPVWHRHDILGFRVVRPIG